MIQHPIFRSVTLVTVFSWLLTSCGSYQGSSYYDTDGIYNTSLPKQEATIAQQQPKTENRSADSYRDYFNGKANEYEDGYLENEPLYFTDVENYTSRPADSVYTDSSYVNTTANYAYNNGNAGWGSNPTDVNINVYNDPYWYGGYAGWGWNSPYYGWGWNRWGYGNYWGWGYDPYWYGSGFGFGFSWGWGYSHPYYGYGNGWYSPRYYNRRNVAYSRGRRGSSNNLAYNSRSNSTRRSINNTSRNIQRRNISTDNNSRVRSSNNRNNISTRNNNTRNSNFSVRTRNSNNRTRTNNNNSNYSTRTRTRTSTPSTKTRSRSYSPSRSSGSYRSSGGGSRSIRSSGGRRGGR